MRRMLACLVLILSFTPTATPAEQDKPPTAYTAATGHWPQWRGPLRDGISTEKSLLREWPPGGPPLLWKVQGLGDGIGCTSIAGGLIFAQGTRDGKDCVTALDGSGRIVWSVPLGPPSGEVTSMRFVTQRSPTVDDARLYVTTWQGILFCLESATGRTLWKKNYIADLGGRAPPWAFGDSPLIDGMLVICSPNGINGTFAALNKESGRPVWRSSDLKDSTNAAIVRTEIDGIPQYVVLTYDRVAGISAKDGGLLWKADRHGQTAVVMTPIVHQGIVFVSSGFGVGGHAFQVTKVEDRFRVEALYEAKPLESHRGGVVCVGEHLYGTNHQELLCLDVKTGEVLWRDRSVGKACVVAVDGMLVVRGERGELALVEAVPEGYREKGRFTHLEKPRENAHTQPVVAGGRLYLRDFDTLSCYDLRTPEYKEPPAVWNLLPLPGKKPEPVRPAPMAGEEIAPAAYVPTPQDVVEKMIALAKITKDDVVYDLGSGDGRIVLTASRNHGCKSTGFEINPGLVWEARTKVKQQKLDALVTIEEKDLFTADLSAASVVTLYLGEPNNGKLLPQLLRMKAGSRIVSHAHLLGAEGPAPDQVIKVTSTEDHDEHVLYLWTLPLRLKK